MKDGDTPCCPKFDPKKWDKKKVTWQNKLFVKGKAFSFFHIPLNLENVIRKITKKIEAKNALPKELMILSDEESLFHTNIYVSTKKAIPAVHDIKVRGTFLTKVFEGPYKNIKKWKIEMEEYVKLQKKELKHTYTYYPNCPKESGKNYVVLFAEI